MTRTLARRRRPPRVAPGGALRPSASDPPLAARWRAVRAAAEAGMTTAEYAVGTLAACTFAAVLIAVVKSGAISSALSKLIAAALAVGS